MHKLEYKAKQESMQFQKDEALAWTDKLKEEVKMEMINRKFLMLCEWNALQKEGMSEDEINQVIPLVLFNN